MQETFESRIEDQADVKPLPPVHETVLSIEMKQSLQDSLLVLFPSTTLDILTLCKRCKALKMGAFTLGSERSKYTTSSLVMVNRRNYSLPHLARIQYYLQCSIFQGGKVILVWVAAVSFF